MTPIGHFGISFLVAAGIIRFQANLSPIDVQTAILAGGVLLDADLAYSFYKRGKRAFDKNIGKHRFLPTHTTYFVIMLGLLIAGFGLSVYSLKIVSWAYLFVLGGMLHLILDTLFFPEGINFLYPFSRKMTRFFYIRVPSFWASKEISGVDDWFTNYSRSPLFWVFEVLPFILALIILKKSYF